MSIAKSHPNNGEALSTLLPRDPLEGGRLSIQVYIHRHTACNSVYPRLYSYYKVKKLGIGVTVDFDKLSTLEKINKKDNGFYIKKFVVKVLGFLESSSRKSKSTLLCCTDELVGVPVFSVLMLPTVGLCVYHVIC